MKRGLGIDLEREWKKLKRRHFFYLVLPIFLTMLSVRIIQVYFHLKMEQLKRAAASQSPAEGGRQAVPEPARAEAAEMEFFTPEPAPAERLPAAAPELAAGKAAAAGEEAAADAGTAAGKKAAADAGTAADAKGAGSCTVTEEL